MLEGSGSPTGAGVVGPTTCSPKCCAWRHQCYSLLFKGCSHCLVLYGNGRHTSLSLKSLAEKIPFHFFPGFISILAIVSKSKCSHSGWKELYSID